MKKLIFSSIVFLLFQFVGVSHAYQISDVTYEYTPLVGTAVESINKTTGQIGTLAEAGGLEGYDYGSTLSSSGASVSGRIAIGPNELVYLNVVHEGNIMVFGSDSMASGTFDFDLGGIKIYSQMVSDPFYVVDSSFYYSVNGEKNFLTGAPYQYSGQNSAWFAISLAQGTYDFSYEMQSYAEVNDVAYMTAVEHNFLDDYSYSAFAGSDFIDTGSALFDSVLPTGVDLANVQKINSQPVPEPTTILLSSLGLLGMGAYIRRRRKK